jgi:hypothetical protein
MDDFFDGMEKVVGGIEQSKKFAEESEPEDAEIVSESRSRPDLMWAHADEAYHIFEGFARSSVCGSNFEPSSITDRKTEMNKTKITACGICLRILHSRYQNA